MPIAVAAAVLPPLPEEIERAIQSAFKGTRNGWVELLKEYEQTDPDQRSGLGIPHPRALELLAEVVNVKLPPVPQWVPVSAPAADTAAAGTPAAAE